MSIIARITGTAIAAVLALGALTACSSDVTPAPVETMTAATQAPAPSGTTQPAPVETSPAEPEVVADENSQVVDGILFQGTEKAPVRIGDDTPGQAPVLDAEIADTISGQGDWETSLNQIVTGEKYVVAIGTHFDTANELDGYTWYVIQENQYGNVKVLEKGPVFGSTDEAVLQVFTVDGRPLDRAEYVLVFDAR